MYASTLPCPKFPSAGSLNPSNSGCDRLSNAWQHCWLVPVRHQRFARRVNHNSSRSTIYRGIGDALSSNHAISYQLLPIDTLRRLLEILQADVSKANMMSSTRDELDSPKTHAEAPKLVDTQDSAGQGGAMERPHLSNSEEGADLHVRLGIPARPQQKVGNPSK